PATALVEVNKTRLFSATGGVGSPTFTVVSGGGSFSGATFTAPATVGTSIVRVTDGVGHTSDATVTRYAPLIITPAAPAVTVGQTVVFSASGGHGAYTF